MTATPAPAPAQGPAPAAPSVPTLDAACGIAAGRRRIDVLDDAIIALVRRRLEISGGIQRLRLASGGRRIEHSREVDVVNRYAAALGRPGSDLALALLALSRGAAAPFAGSPTGAVGPAVVRDGSAGRDSLA